MSLLGLAWRNLRRNRLRSVLTIAGAVMAVLTFLLLRTVVWSYHVGVEYAVKDRIVTRHKVTFIMPVPYPYIAAVRATPGVTKATWANWFGGKLPGRREEFFMAVAVDAPTYLDVYDEMVVTPEERRAFQEDRRGAIVGHVLAAKAGWKVGDTARLESDIFPGQWDFTVRGIYHSTRKVVDESQFLMHWEYFNEEVKKRFELDHYEEVGWIVSRVDGDRVNEVCRVIDAGFDPKEPQTVTQDESTFQRSFMAGFQAVLTALDVSSLAILAILGMILGNTIAMGVRERAHEYGVLRAIGFRPHHLFWTIVGEAGFLGIVGGLAGLGLGYVVIEGLFASAIEQSPMAGWFPYFSIGGLNAVFAVLASGVAAFLAAVLPAVQVARLNVVDAIRRVA